ncbi:Ubiquitin-like domain-containing CTD phosphatase [Triticum urartu]|uniref:protein-serine/threonine phosphatase n=1 Tax=Triticum urartu TaxID=4572 RepID=M7ZBW0_TRIUA|nr:Ubiquitin-like domain-containing CTD phosphatase [Triticum urartu]
MQNLRCTEYGLDSNHFRVRLRSAGYAYPPRLRTPVTPSPISFSPKLPTVQGSDPRTAHTTKPMSEASSSSAATPASAPPPAPALDPEAISLMAEEAPPEEITLVVKWSGKEYTVRAMGDDTLLELKRRICEFTDVLPKRQKLLYPKLILNDESVLLSSLPFKPNGKLTMIGTVALYDICSGTVELAYLMVDLGIRYFGVAVVEYVKGTTTSEISELKVRKDTSGILTEVSTVEDEIFVDRPDDPEVLDDYEFFKDEVTAIKDNVLYKQKVKRRASQYKIKLLNPCRDGKRLLVLDIDYTLFDHRSPAENPLELMRPFLHEFLAAAYAEYDIMIWSATNMKWVQLKMEQLGVLSNPNYKITALLDHMAMITVHAPDKKVFDCKPLGVIWTKFPEHYNEKNTIMFDDLRRNFVMNPQNGLVIRPFKNASKNRGRDQELRKLTQYLLSIAELEDFSKLEHDGWESFMDETGKRRRRR